MADVAVIIPAYNEAPRVGAVVRAALAAREVHSVLVVDDGSTDGTAEVAQSAGASVLQKQNGGKASAMDAGVHAVANGGLCFLDADLVGLTPAHVDSLIEPWLHGAKMVVGLDQRSQHILWSTFAGPRVISRGLWFEATALEPAMLTSGYGVEVILAILANRYRWPVAEVRLAGIHAPVQAAKWGGSRLLHGMKMFGRIAQVAGRTSGRRVVEELLSPMLWKRGFVNVVRSRHAGWPT